MKIMKVNKNLYKSIKFDANSCKHIKYKESPQRTRSQPGIEQRFYRGSKLRLTVQRPHAPKSMEIHENPRKSLEIYTNLWKSMKYDESPQKTRSQPETDQRFLQQVESYRPKTPWPDIRGNPSQSMQIYIFC